MMKETSFQNKIRKSSQREYNRDIQSPLYETLKRFRDAVDYTEPLSYEEWLNVKDEYKAAVLYVQFFDEICLAYYKSRSFYSPEEDNDSIVLQYLQKNVPIIEKDRNRFKASYIYRVAYNCMFCQSRGIKRDLQRFETEVSNLGVSGGDEYDLFDYISEPSSIEGIINREHFWHTIYNLGDDAVSIVENLLNGGRLPAGLKHRKAEIIDQLKIALISFVDLDA